MHEIHAAAVDQPVADDLISFLKSLLKTQPCPKMGQLLSPDARSPGEQRLPVLLLVDRGADPGQSSAAADPETGGSGP